MRDKVATPSVPGGPDSRAVVGIGTPLPGVTVQIRDEADCVLPERALGEIVVQTPMIFSGYWKQPQLTQRVLRDGWYYTGDMGYFAGDELFIVGRLKDLIIVDGRNVLPDAIEEHVLAAGQGQLHSAVAFGVRDEALGTEQPVVVCEMALALDDEQRQQLAQAIRARVRKMVDVALADLRFVEGGWIVRAGVKLARNANREKYLAQFPPRFAQDFAQDIETPRRSQRTPSEEVTAIFAEVLGRPQIGADENFFDLGGDSISALKMLLLVEKRLSRSVPPEFFQRPTVANLVNLLDNPNAAKENVAKENAVKEVDAARPIHYDNSASTLSQRPKPPVLPKKWTRQHIRRAARWRLIDSAFRLPYFEAMERFARWSGDRFVQTLFYPQEVQLFSRFCASLGRANANNEQELTCSVMSDILIQRLGAFYENDRERFIQRLRNSSLAFVRDIGQALDEPDGDLGRQIFRVHGSEHLENSIQQGRGTILLTFHNSTRVLGMPALFRRTEPLFSLTNRIYFSIYRDLYGVGTPQDLADQMPFLRTNATQKARETLLAGGIVTMTADSPHIKRPIHMTIGDRVRPIPTGFAELALATGAAVIPTYATMQPTGQINQYIQPPCDSGDASWSHDARVEHMARQIGAFMAQAWHHAPSALEWSHMRLYFEDLPVESPPPSQKLAADG
jgi:lauroyl/myristoyl acyltransferase/acyl carrier protein